MIESFIIIYGIYIAIFSFIMLIDSIITDFNNSDDILI